MDNLLQQLTESINIHLDLCDEQYTPTVCGMLADPEAREKLVKLVIEKVVVSRNEISDAIIAIEKEYNPNEID